MVINIGCDTDNPIFQVLTMATQLPRSKATFFILNPVYMFFCFSAGKQISSSPLYLVARC